MVQCNQSFYVFLLSEGNFAFMQSYIHMYIACRIVSFARTRSTRDAARNNCLLCTRHALPQPPYPPPKKNPHLSRSPIAPLPLPPPKYTCPTNCDGASRIVGQINLNLPKFVHDWENIGLVHFSMDPQALHSMRTGNTQD